MDKEEAFVYMWGKLGQNSAHSLVSYFFTVFVTQLRSETLDSGKEKLIMKWVGSDGGKWKPCQR